MSLLLPMPLRRWPVLLAVTLDLVSAQDAGEGMRAAAWDSDDECTADRRGEADCALNALQRPGRSASNSTSSARQIEVEADRLDSNYTFSGAGPPSPRRHRYMATATKFVGSRFSSCMVDTAKFVAGTDYHAVATSEAMQDGCCTCNHAGHGGPHTAKMGCGSCGRGHFLYKYAQPFKMKLPASSPLFHREYKFVVVDICPYYEQWCQRRAGHPNRWGAYNHIDFATIPEDFDNYYFEFTPEPCSRQIEERFRTQSKCWAWWERQKRW